MLASPNLTDLLAVPGLPSPPSPFLVANQSLHSYLVAHSTLPSLLIKAFLTQTFLTCPPAFSDLLTGLFLGCPTQPFKLDHATLS